MQQRAHNCCTPMDPCIWPSKSWTTSENIHAATEWGYGCIPEDLPETMNDREKWRERARDICANGMTWWWWWYIYIYICVCVCVCVCVEREKDGVFEEETECKKEKLTEVDRKIFWLIIGIKLQTVLHVNIFRIYSCFWYLIVFIRYLKKNICKVKLCTCNSYIGIWDDKGFNQFNQDPFN